MMSRTCIDLDIFCVFSIRGGIKRTDIFTVRLTVKCPFFTPPLIQIGENEVIFSNFEGSVKQVPQKLS